MKSGLFVIKKSDCDQYWTCSREHGSGWNPKRPKQSFSKSELSKEIFRMAEAGLGKQRIEIIELEINNG